MTFFGWKFGFRKCFGAFAWPSHWGGHHWLLYEIHFSSHVTIQSRNGSLLLHRIREEDTSKRCGGFFCCFLWVFLVSTWDIHLLSFFTFPICFKCWMTIEWSTLSSSTTSLVVVRGSAWTTVLNWSLSTSNGQPLHYSSSRLSSPLQNFLNHRCTICSLAVPGPNALLMLQVVSAALWPILNLNKKNCSNLLLV